jgi:5-methylcytosine-specific restriction endonuclease McrA
MKKYKQKGGERKYCSFSCNFASVPFEIRSEFSIRANETKRKEHPPKSHQNKLARVHPKYKEWREAVYKRDDYTCQDCGKRGGELHPHHIKPFATFPKFRYEVSNGVTLCKGCHRKRHNHVFIGRTKRESVQ